MLVHELETQISGASTIRLFLDYDGTLANFSSSPDTVLPDQNLVDLLIRLTKTNGTLPAIISGRKLAHLQKLIPVPEILLGGTYGIELKFPDGRILERAPYIQVRDSLTHLLPQWQELLGNEPSLFLEDKGWALAIHNRQPESQTNHIKIQRAKALAYAIASTSKILRVSGSDEFLEILPVSATKKETFKFILQNYLPTDVLPISIGDDANDEEAFTVIREYKGITIRVSAKDERTHATLRLKSPSQVREWLNWLIALRQH